MTFRDTFCKPEHHNTRLQPEGYGGRARPQDAKQRGEPGDYRHSVLPELLQELLLQERLPQERLLQSPWWRGLAESMPKPTCLSVAASTSCRSMPPLTDQGIITRNWTLTRETDGRRYIMVIHVTRETCRDKVGSDHTKKIQTDVSLRCLLHGWHIGRTPRQNASHTKSTPETHHRVV